MGVVVHALGETILALFVIVVCVIIEQVAVIERFSLRSRIPGVLMNVVGTGLSAGLIWPLSRLWDLLGVHTLIRVPLWDWLEPMGWLGYALQFLALIVIADFLAYWRHRAEHSWFWPIHAVHHSPTELHAANDIGHPTQVWFTMLFVALPMSLVQIDGPTTPVAVAFVVTVLSYYIHSPIDVHFGLLRKVLVDNRFHRIHHSLEQRHFDKNFGICFSIWDRWFGTAYDPATDEWPKVGLAEVPAPATLVDFLAMPLAFLPGRKKAGWAAADGLSADGDCQVTQG